MNWIVISLPNSAAPNCESIAPGVPAQAQGFSTGATVRAPTCWCAMLLARLLRVVAVPGNPPGPIASSGNSVICVVSICRCRAEERSQHKRSPRPHPPRLRPRPQAGTPLAQHAVPPLEPQAQPPSSDRPYAVLDHDFDAFLPKTHRCDLRERWRLNLSTLWYVPLSCPSVQRHPESAGFRQPLSGHRSWARISKTYA